MSAQEENQHVGRLRRALRFLAKSALLMTLVLAGCGALYEALAGLRDARSYPPPGQLYDLGGYRLHLHCLGQGRPTVVLEAGLGRDSLDWSWVQPGLAKLTRVCSYDRAGAGWSDPGPLPRDSRSVAGELRALLDRAGIIGPLVLVGHSAGGSHTRLFQHLHPDNVTGMILVDVSHLQSPRPPSRSRTVIAKALHFVGLMRGLGFLDGHDLPPDVQPIANALAYRRTFLSTLVAENTDAAQSLRQVLDITVDGALGNLPLRILTAARPVEDEERLPPGMTLAQAREERAKRQAKQREMLGMSTDSQQILARRSGHQIHKDQPELLIAAVAELVEEIRAMQHGLVPARFE